MMEDSELRRMFVKDTVELERDLLLLLLDNRRVVLDCLVTDCKDTLRFRSGFLLLGLRSDSNTHL